MLIRRRNLVIGVVLSLAVFSASAQGGPPPGGSPGGPPLPPAEIAPGHRNDPDITNFKHLQSGYLVLDEICASYIAELLAAKDWGDEATGKLHMGFQKTRTFDDCDKSGFLVEYRGGGDLAPVVYLKCPSSTVGAGKPVLYSIIEGRPGGLVTHASTDVNDLRPRALERLKTIQAMPTRFAPECIRQR